MITRVAFVTATSVLLALALGISLPEVGTAQATPQNPAPQAAAPPPQAGMADMMKMHEQMMVEMKAAHAKLDALVKDMNTAAGQAKVDATAAVVNELVQQQKAMHERMGQMHEQMMGGGGRGMMKQR